jgi:predicted hydrocarbon binding protein
MKVVETESTGERGGRIVLRLVGFEHESRHFCRRQTGGLAKAVEIAGGERPRVRHVRCALEGDAFCEWELRWE